MKSISKSFTAIIVLNSATASSSVTRAETKEVGVVEEEAAGTVVVPPSSSVAAPRPRPRLRRRTRRSNREGRRRVRHGGESSRNGNIDGRDDNIRNKDAQTIKPSPRKQARRLQQQVQRRTAAGDGSKSSAAAPGCGPTAGTRHSPYLGCYPDRSNDRAFPFELYGGMSRNKRLGHGALDCERECGERGFRYFGREFKGQCFCGDDIDSIVRHGGAQSGCDCCGKHVGGGSKMCVWENANHQDSHAQLPSIPAILPQLSHQVSTAVEIQHVHSHIGTAISNNNNNNQQSSNSNNDNDQVASTHKPTGTFRLRLHWERGYNWQNKSRERFFCMECRGSCKSGSSVQVDQCKSSSTRQKFIAVSKTIRPAYNPSLCLAVSGFSGRRSPVRLRRCDRGPSQNFREVRSSGKFELQPQTGDGERCLSQHHHPREHEVVFPEKCEKTRRFDTTYWTTY